MLGFPGFREWVSPLPSNWFGATKLKLGFLPLREVPAPVPVAPSEQPAPAKSGEPAAAAAAQAMVAQSFCF